MLVRRKILFAIIGLLPSLALGQSTIGPVTPEAEKLAATLDKMDVAHNWLPGERVAWKTGKTIDKQAATAKGHTHCSAFAAAAGEKLGIYLLHPPEHSSTLLANAQYDWLASEKASKDGWKLVPNGIEAQSQANRGLFVVAVYKESDPKRPGHIAVIRPENRTAAKIQELGPAITQAGGTNMVSGDLRNGFSRHKGAFPDKIRFYAHEIKEKSS